MIFTYFYKTLLLFLLFFCCTIGKSQSIFVTDEIPLRNQASYDILGDFEGKTLLFLDKITDFEIIAFNDKLFQLWTKELELDKKNPSVLGIIAPNSKEFNILYHHRYKGHPILKISKYDASATLIDSMTVKDYGLKFYNPNWQILRSEDKSKLLIYEISNAKNIIAIVFDILKMEVLWEHDFKETIALNYGRDIQQLLIDNEGRLHTIMSRDNLSSKKKQHHFEVYQYDGATNTLSSHKIPMEEKLTYDVFFQYDNLNQHLVAGGLYSNKNRGKSNGYYFLNIPSEQPANYQLHVQTFEDEFVNEFLDKDKDAKNKGIANTDIQEIVLRRDGGILLIAEENKTYSRTTSTNATRGVYNEFGNNGRDYYYNDIFIISIHPTGKTHWKNILHKKQYSYDDDGLYSSYFLLKTPSSLRFLFNDEIKNENTVSEYILKGNGKYDRNSLMNTKDQGMQLRFQDAFQVASRSLVVPSERRNRLKLVKIAF